MFVRRIVPLNKERLVRLSACPGLRDGKRPHGSMIGFPDDFDVIVFYLRTLKPVDPLRCDRLQSER